jgi:D-glycero-D-manno-heptose 1,7-bisphosphate phosphatase
MDARRFRWPEPTSQLSPAVFLDRDGVLNRSFVRDGIPRPPANLDEFEWLPDVSKSVTTLAAAGFALVVVTNQPDVAHGTQTKEMVKAINRRVADQLPVLGVLTCYHNDSANCECRKPRPGMLLKAARRWHLDLSRSFLIGDRWRDVEAGRAAGCRSVLIETPYSGRERCRPDRCVPNLAEAVRWLLAVSQVPLWSAS